MIKRNHSAISKSYLNILLSNFAWNVHGQIENVISDKTSLHLVLKTYLSVYLEYVCVSPLQNVISVKINRNIILKDFNIGKPHRYPLFFQSRYFDVNLSVEEGCYGRMQFLLRYPGSRQLEALKVSASTFKIEQGSVAFLCMRSLCWPEVSLIDKGLVAPHL